MSESSIIIRRYEFVDRSSIDHRRSNGRWDRNTWYNTYRILVPYVPFILLDQFHTKLVMEFVLSYFEYLFYTPLHATINEQRTGTETTSQAKARSEQAKTGDQPLTTEIFAQLVTNYHSGTVLLV